MKLPPSKVARQSRGLPVEHNHAGFRYRYRDDYQFSAVPDRISYRVKGICYWLLCTLTGCSVETSVKVNTMSRMQWSPVIPTREEPWGSAGDEPAQRQRRRRR